MAKIGNRIIYDQDGEIIIQLGEIEGDVLPRKTITNLYCLDLEFGAIDYSKQRIVKINPETHEPIIENIEIPLSPEQQRIIELENQLLLLSGVI